METGNEFVRVLKNIVFFALWIFLSQVPTLIVSMPFYLQLGFQGTEYEAMGNQLAQQSNLIFGIIGIIVAIVVTVLLYRAYERQRRTNVIDYRPLKSWSPDFLSAVGLGLIGLLLLLMLEGYLSRFVPVSENQSILESMYTVSPWSLIFISVIFAPFTEELLYRGIFFNYFFQTNEKVGILAGVLVNGILFGWLHDSTFTLITLPYILMGALFAYSYRRSKDLKVSIALHFLNNLLAVALMWAS
ncbi:CPBP family intramembrane glutamic endopeptidase [Enterococcus nangangensis]